MRRTADSLLILADAPTATAGVDGLTVSDALQAATSGVQDYQRVQIRSANPMRIDDSAAADVVHLLTELVDNALTYSPPTSTVTVGSRTTAEGVVIEITELRAGHPPIGGKTNRSLGSGRRITPTPRRMGLFVVSRLSQRHGFTTSLRASDEERYDGRGDAADRDPPGPGPDPVPKPSVAASKPDARKPAGRPKADRKPQKSTASQSRSTPGRTPVIDVRPGSTPPGPAHPWPGASVDPGRGADAGHRLDGVRISRRSDRCAASTGACGAGEPRSPRT
jgi:hypothetical protein